MSTSTSSRPGNGPTFAKSVVEGLAGKLLIRLAIFSGVAGSLLLSVLILRGCDTNESFEYGATEPPGKSSSINGLGVFERMCVTAGYKCLVATKLSARLEKSRVLIMVGNTPSPLSMDARNWLEEWLARVPGRSVVYFGRDFDAEHLYRRETLRHVPKEQQNEAALELALALSESESASRRPSPEEYFCRWFFIRPHDPRVDVTKFTGPWAKDLADEQGAWPVRTWLEPPRRPLQKTMPKWGPAVVGGLVNGMVVGAKGNGSSFRTTWTPGEISDAATWQSEWEKAPQYRVLLADSTGKSLVTRLTSKDYPDGQILIVANGFPFLNGSLLTPLGRGVAHKIIDEFELSQATSSKRLTFVSFDDSGLIISDIDEDEIGPVGMQMLTIWPMSMVTMHAALLGIVVCIILLPILGRPQAGPRPSLSDFGHHVEANGKLLQGTSDYPYAMRMIAAYFQIVRGDAPPSWLVIAPTNPPATSQTIVTATEVARQPSPGTSPANPSTGQSSVPFDHVIQPAGDAKPELASSPADNAARSNHNPSL